MLPLVAAGVVVPVEVEVDVEETGLIFVALPEGFCTCEDGVVAAEVTTPVVVVV